MLVKLIIAISGVVLVVVAALYFFGRDEVEETTAAMERPPGLIEATHLQTLRLYFGEPNAFSLRVEERTVASAGRLSDRLSACVRELAAGSLTGGAAVLPPDARLNHSFVDPWGLAYLDFDRSLRGAYRPGDGEEWLAIAALVRTICDNFAEVRAVRLMIDGEIVSSLGGYIDLEQPLSSRDFPLEEAM